MRDKWKYILILLLLIGVIGLFTFYFFYRETKRLDPRFSYGSKKGEEAKDFELSTLQGNTVKLSDYRGKVVFLNIWATWCPPCREEMPFMEALYRRLKDRDFEILAVSIDRKGKEVVGPFVEKYGLTFPILLDPENTVYKLYGLTGVPETFIVYRNGVIQFKIIGPQNWVKQEWLDTFDQILRKK